MKLIEALQINRVARSTTGKKYSLSVVSGFTPLHLSTFLEAELRSRHADRDPEVHESDDTEISGEIWIAPLQPAMMPSLFCWSGPIWTRVSGYEVLVIGRLQHWWTCANRYEAERHC